MPIGAVLREIERAGEAKRSGTGEGGKIWGFAEGFGREAALRGRAEERLVKWENKVCSLGRKADSGGRASIG